MGVLFLPASRLVRLEPSNTAEEVDETEEAEDAAVDDVNDVDDGVARVAGQIGA